MFIIVKEYRYAILCFAISGSVLAP